MIVTTFNISTSKKNTDIGALGNFDILALQEVHESLVLKLQSDLPEYNCFFTNNNNGKSNFGIFTAVSKKLEILSFDETEVISLQDRLLDKDKKRNAQFFNIRGEDGKFDFVNLHLPVYRFYEKKLVSLQKIIEKVGEDKAIISGDFNFTSVLGLNKKLLDFMDDAGFMNAASVKNTRNGFPSAGQVDYIFQKGFSGVKSCGIVIGKFFSDHSPLTCNLYF